MARIRTIKPEFPQSESMGRVSRDARLLFVQLWTLADDSGRARGNSRMLASLLFPYDDDAPSLIDEWLCELELAGCVRRYTVDNDSYLDIPNWLKHQKIDKPSPSKIPPFDEASRKVAKPRERSSEDQGPGPRTKDQGEDQGSLEPRKEKCAARARGSRWPADAVVTDEWIIRGQEAREEHGLAPLDLRLEASRFQNYWSSKSGGGATKLDWHRTWLNWCINAKGATNGRTNGSGRKSTGDVLREIASDVAQIEALRRN